MLHVKPEKAICFEFRKRTTYDAIVTIEVLQLLNNLLSTVRAPVVYNDHLEVNIPKSHKRFLRHAFAGISILGIQLMKLGKGINYRRCLKTR